MPEPETPPSGKPARSCPECGVSMTNRDPVGHAKDHWPDQLSSNDPLVLKARQRRAALLGLPIPEAEA